MNSASALIGDWLGVEPPMTEAAVLGIIERQLDPPVIQRLFDMGLSRDEVHSVIIPARTLQHRRSRNERLTIEESDRVIRALRVLCAAEGVYESRERALQWLRRSQPRLGGQRRQRNHALRHCGSRRRDLRGACGSSRNDPTGTCGDLEPGTARRQGNRPAPSPRTPADNQFACFRTSETGTAHGCDRQSCASY